MRRAAVLAAAAAIVAGCAPRGRTGAAAPPSPRAAAAWVEQTLAGLSLEERVGQMLMGRVWGDFSSLASPDFRAIAHEVQDLGVGGVAISIGSPPEIALKTNALQALAKVPLLVGADVEYGPGMRLWTPTYLPYLVEGGGGTILPYNMGIGAIGDTAAAFAAGRLTALESRAVGINWVFAPVADVNTEPTNPIVNVRSYGADPRAVARLVAAFVRGAHDGRALTAVKHFPGHGDTGVDSHVDLPVLRVGRERLDLLELVPFRAALGAGTDAVMVGHLAIPALTGGKPVPATVAPEIGQTLLRRELGYDGLVITDAMTMGALRNLPGYSPGELAVWAVQAGADVVLGPPDVAAARDAIVAAVRAGRIPAERIDASVRRILAAKARLGLPWRRAVDPDSVARIVGSAEHRRIADDLARRSITLVRDSAGVLPLDPRSVRSVALLTFAAPTELNAGRALQAELTRIYGRAEASRLSEASTPAEVDSAVARAARADAVVFATFYAPVSGQGFLRLPDRVVEAWRRVRAAGRPVVGVSFGDPYGTAALEGLGTYLLAWQPRGEPAQRAVAAALAGLAPIAGRLPVPLPGAPLGSGTPKAAIGYTLGMAEPTEVGMDPRALAAVDSIVARAVADRVTPGAALAVGRHGKLVRLRGYGALDYAAGSPAASDSTLYDLASLSKVIGTTTAVMVLSEDGLLDLDAPVARYLPEWQGSPAKLAVTVRQLLMHDAGLPPFLPLWRELRGREAYLKRIGTTPLEYEPGTRTVYSDLGLILTGLIVERVSGTTLDRFLEERVFGPLRLRDTGYTPLAARGTAKSKDRRGARPSPSGDADCTAAYAAGDSLLRRIAPTEVDTIYRHRHVHGIVHDENACALGGVAGHAGLFSSARDLAVFAQMLLNGGFYRDVRIVKPSTVAAFTARADAASSRALGWDTPSPRSSAGDYFSARSFGHTGFTGTSIWIDPERDLFLVLLTNRVNPTRDNPRIAPLRRAVADAVQRAITDVRVEKRVDVVSRDHGGEE
ncbi:MAG TPA: serine hydrolase [Longimicrobiales bacterium]|nr:serine hydrolase [Longimicrobiales bacterium]